MNDVMKHVDKKTRSAKASGPAVKRRAGARIAKKSAAEADLPRRRSSAAALKTEAPSQERRREPPTKAKRKRQLKRSLLEKALDVLASVPNPLP